MDRLGGVAGDLVTVECSTCNQRSRYRIAGLAERFGPDISSADLLRALTASCRLQRAPSSAASRKYEAGCTARINLPKPASLEPPVPPGRHFTIMV
jgi:hypothetical protein